MKKDQKSALDLVKEEREKQLKKGYTPEYDSQYENLELKNAAVCVLSGNPGKWPQTFSNEHRDKYLSLSYKERLVIGIAFALAELERVELEEDKINAGKGESAGSTVPPAGDEKTSSSNAEGDKFTGGAGAAIGYIAGNKTVDPSNLGNKAAGPSAGKSEKPKKPKK